MASMPPKRKHLDVETATDASYSDPVKKIRISPQSSKSTTTTISKRKKPADDSDIDPTCPNPAKRSKPSPKSSRDATPKATAKRERSVSTKGPTVKSSLLPRGGRRRATVGQRDDSLLRMLCDDSKTGEVKELHFRKIPHSMIDWNNSKHIRAINSWRSQIYGRAGLKTKDVTVWHEEEELWFELYFHLSIVESRARGILLPKTRAVLDAFNKAFVGRVLKDKSGAEIEARGERQANAFTSKFNRKCPHLRARLQQCVFGKSGDTFVPTITPAILKKYQQMKTDMTAKGITGESAYSEHLEEWQCFLSNLPTSDEIELHDNHNEAAKDAEKTDEGDAAAALISLAHQPVNVQENLWMNDEHNAIENSGSECTNGDSASQPDPQNITPPYTPPQTSQAPQEVRVAAIKSENRTPSAIPRPEPPFAVFKDTNTRDFVRTTPTSNL